MRRNSRASPPISGAAVNHMENLLMKEIQKSRLNPEGAAVHSGIEVNKLRDITNDESGRFVLWVGNRKLIKRRLFDLFIEQAHSV